MRYVVLPTFKKSFPPKTGLTANGSWLTFELNSSIQFSWDCKLIWQLVLSILVLLHSTCRCEFRMADVRIMSKAFGQLQNKWNWIIRTLCMGANVAWAATGTQQLNGWATCGKFNPNRSKKKKKIPNALPKKTVTATWKTQRQAPCYMTKLHFTVARSYLKHEHDIIQYLEPANYYGEMQTHFSNLTL